MFFQSLSQDIFQINGPLSQIVSRVLPRQLLFVTLLYYIFVQLHVIYKIDVNIIICRYIIDIIRCRYRERLNDVKRKKLLQTRVFKIFYYFILFHFFF